MSKNKESAAAVASASQTTTEQSYHAKFKLPKLLFDDKVSNAEAKSIFDDFNPKNPVDIEIYAKCAKKFGFSIDLTKVKSRLPESFKGSLREFSDYIKAFYECGFSQEDLAEHVKEIHAKTFDLLNEEFSKRNPNAINIIALLINLKNLGILENLEEKHINDLRKALILLPEFRLSEADSSLLAAISLHCQEVLKIGLLQQEHLVDYREGRKKEEKEFKKNPDQYLMNLIDAEKLELEEFEQLLLEHKSKIDSKKSTELMRNLFAKVIKEKSENIELFLLLVVNCTTPEWKEIRKDIKDQVKDKTVLNAILQKRDTPGKVKNDTSGELFNMSSYFTENRENLRKFILGEQDDDFEFSSRWELEYSLLESKTRAGDTIMPMSTIGNFFLLLATDANNTEAVRFILKKKESSQLTIKEEEENESALLENCFDYKNPVMLRLLIKCGYKFSRREHINFFLRALSSKDAEMLSCFIEDLHYKVNAKVRTTSGDFYSPIQIACDSGNLEAVKYLISKGASLKDLGSEGKSLLYYALTPEIYRFLKQEHGLKFFPDNLSAQEKFDLFSEKLKYVFHRNIQHGIGIAKCLIKEEECEANFFLRPVTYEDVKKMFLTYLISKNEIPFEFVDYISNQDSFVDEFEAHKDFYMKQIVKDCVEIGRTDVIKLFCEKFYDRGQGLDSSGIFEDNAVICKAVESGQADLVKYFIELYKNQGIWDEHKKAILKSASKIPTEKDGGEAKRAMVKILLEVPHSSVNIVQHSAVNVKGVSSEQSK